MKQPKERHVCLWLKKAQADLGIAEHIIENVPRFVEISVFHLQQSAEKAIKAALTWHQIRFQKTHDLKKVGAQLVKCDPSLTSVLQQVEVLRPFAVEIRYPGEDEEITIEKAREYLALGKKIYNEVLKRLPSECQPPAI